MFFYFVEITNSFFFSFFSLFSNYLGKFRMFSFFLLVTLFMDGTTKNSIKISCSFFSTKNQSINKMIESNQYANRETKRILFCLVDTNTQFILCCQNRKCLPFELHILNIIESQTNKHPVFSVKHIHI